MRNFARHHPHWALALLAIVAVTAYWFTWAEDRYVSRAVVVLESPQIAPPDMSFGALLTGGGSHQELLLLREHLLSVDMLRKVEDQLDFRGHYSGNGDYFARLRDAQAPIEDLHRFYERRVDVELDEYAGVLRIEVQAYDADFAHALAELLVAEGEAHMNQMGQRLAEEQVGFLEGQLERLGERLDAARSELLAYQNEHGLVSPTSTVESLNQVVATLEGELASTRARRTAMGSFQSDESSDVRLVEAEVRALEEQIETQQQRLARAEGEALNRISADFQKLELQAKFAEETYSAALSALESTRIEAARKLKQVSVLQSPLYPEYPTEPNRVYNSTVFALITLFLALILSMLILIIRDHRD